MNVIAMLSLGFDSKLNLVGHGRVDIKNEIVYASISAGSEDVIQRWWLEKNRETVRRRLRWGGSTTTMVVLEG